MRQVLAVVTLVSVTSCLNAGGEGHGSSTVIGASSTGAGQTSSTATTSGGPGSSTGVSGQSTGNGTSAGSCGQNNCPSCTVPYSCQNDSCVEGAWRCACGCLDSGVNPPCGNVTCPTGCDLSSDCTECIPESPTAGIGTSCISDRDCCTGTCINGACSLGDGGSSSSSSGDSSGGVCHSEGQGCTTTADCCAGFSCIAGSCTFGGGGSSSSGSSSSGGSSGGMTCSFHACTTTADCCPPFSCLAGSCLITSNEPDGGDCAANSPTFIGTWNGIYSDSDTITTGVVGGTGGPDQETVVAGSAADQVVFAQFLGYLLPACSLTANIQSNSVADFVAGSTCQDNGGGTWTFNTGEAVLNSSCSMSVLASGTYADVNQSGTFALSISLSL